MNGRAMPASRRASRGRPTPPRRPRRVTGRHRTVRARFVLRETPGVTVGPAGHGVRYADGRGPATDGPDLATDAPDLVTDEPDPVADTPDPVTDTPDPVTGAPEPVTDTPDPVTGAPEPVIHAARLAAQRALAEAGRGYLGGRLELRAPGRTRSAHDRRALRRAACRAAALAVAATLRGDDTGVDVRVTRR
ncbi:hypothetical protein ABZ565_21140 [Streptomyces sp. NPDC016469]|uniref:hypothetical protein n=1 Tax=Streptomyces sp. NPDC016469 TaxID=3157191 RepID=UPI0033CD7536